jgi:hypothetical protein
MFRPLPLFLSLIAILGFLALPILAQDGEEAPLTEKPLTEKPADPGGLTGDQKVYIPFKNLKDVFEKEGQGVFVPFDEFLRLWEANLDRRPVPSKPPVPWLVTRAAYQGKVEGDLALVAAEIEFETFGEGWSAVPLHFSGLAMGQARLGDEPATLDPFKGGYNVLVPEKGKYVLKVEFVTPLVRVEDTRTVAFNVPATPVSRLVFDIPEEGARVTVEPNLATTRTDAGSGVTRVMAYVGGAGAIKLSWKPKPAEVKTGPALVFADSMVTATVEELALRVRAEIGYRIHRAPLEALRLAIPEGAKVLFVEGENLRSWEVADGVLSVAMHTAADKQYRLAVTMEVPLPKEGTVAVPEIAALDVARDQGFVLVRAPADVKVLPQATGLYRTDFGDVPKSHRAKDLILAYRYPAHPFALALDVTRIEPVVDVGMRTRIDLDERRLTMTDTLSFNVSRVPIFQVKIAVPEGLEVMDVSRDVVEDWRLVTEDGVRALVLDLKGSRIGVFNVTVVTSRAVTMADEGVEIPLALLTPLKVKRVSGLVGVKREESLKVETKEPKALIPVGAGTFGEGVAMAWQFKDADRGVTLSVTRRDPEVTASVATMLRAEQNRISVRHQITWTVRYAGVEEFAFTLPKELMEKVHVTGNNIREMPQQDVEAEEGTEPRFKHNIVLQGKVMGTYVAEVQYDLPYEGLEVGASEMVDIPRLVVLDVVRETGIFAVYRDQVLQVNEDADRLELIDIRELPAQVEKKDVFLAFKYLTHPYSLKLNVEKHEYLEVLMAVVLHQHVITVLNEEGTARVEVVLTMKNNGLQFLSLKLEPGADGEPVRPDSLELWTRGRNGRFARKSEIPQAGAGGEILVKMPPGVGPEDVFFIKLVYPLRRELPGMIFHDMTFSAPEIQKGSVPVQGTTWYVYPPVGTKITQAGGSLPLLGEEDTWWGAVVASFPQVFETPTQRIDTRGGPSGNLPAGISELAPSGQTPIYFGGRALEATVEVTFVDPSTFVFLKVLVMLGTLALGTFGLRAASKGVRVGFTTISLAFPLLLIPVAARGMAEILTALLIGGLLAGMFWCGRALLPCWIGAFQKLRTTRRAKPADAEVPADAEEE